MNNNFKACGACGKPSRPAARPSSARPRPRPTSRPK